jgi:hypothetical protein
VLPVPRLDAARSATIFKGTASLKLNRDPLGSQFLNDSADAVERCVRPARESRASVGPWLAVFP